MTQETFPLIVGNWKMNGLRADSVERAERLAEQYAKLSNKIANILICPPATLIAQQISLYENTDIMVGGQNCHIATSGPHTGDISAQMLSDLGCSHVILGHSERRLNHQETDDVIKLKAIQAHMFNLNSIICVGETEDQKNLNIASRIVNSQLMSSIPTDCLHTSITIAYEPVWAIGSGRIPDPDEIAELHGAIRQNLTKQFGANFSDKIPILYGGSVKPTNARELLSIENVNGLLVGGASLNWSEFWAIIKNCHI
ncbi:MAG: triose-phosphate isomerase [Pseudomonadota bacterium]|nr:triose-phosphate isomerase [Pseudomonadota bacterium]